MSRQKTIRTPAVVEGLGLFGGVACRLRFSPADANAGVIFVRSDAPAAGPIPATTASLSHGEPRRSVLTNGRTSVSTVEHVMSAVWGLGVDNVTIEASAEEMPNTDGSPLPFAEALQKAGIVEQPAERRVQAMTSPVTVSKGAASMTLSPGPTDILEIVFDMDYGDAPGVGRWVHKFALGQDDYLTQLAPARTFLLEAEAKAFSAMGWGRHLSTSSVLVIGPIGPIDNALRFIDELVRHKVCDLIGDIALVGRRIVGRLEAVRSGHGLNHALAAKLAELPF